MQFVTDAAQAHVDTFLWSRATNETALPFVQSSKRLRRTRKDKTAVTHMVKPPSCLLSEERLARAPALSVRADLAELALDGRLVVLALALGSPVRIAIRAEIRLAIRSRLTRGAGRLVHL